MADEDDVAALRDEIARLRTENERLRKEAPPVAAVEPAPRAEHHRARWTFSIALIVIGSLLVPVSVVGVWLNRTITDADRYVETVAPLVRDPAIQKAVSARLERALYANVDIESEVQKVLPEKATVLAAPITAGIKSLVGDLIQRLIKSDRFAQLWDRANRLAQQQVVAVLTEANGKKGVVEIDLTGPAKEVASRLKSLGVPFFSNVGKQPITFDVLQSEQIAQVQQGFKLFDRLATILPWLTLIILAAGVLVAPRRRQGLAYAATGWVLATALLLIGVALGRAVYINALPVGASIPANQAFYDTMSRYLRGGGRTVLVVGLVVLLVALVTGPSAPAVRLRAALARLFGSAGAGIESTGVDLGPVGAFVGRNLMALRVVVGVLALVVLLSLGQPSAGAVLWIVVGALVVLALLEVLARAAAPHPTSDGGEASPPNATS